MKSKNYLIWVVKVHCLGQTAVRRFFNVHAFRSFVDFIQELKRGYDDWSFGVEEV